MSEHSHSPPSYVSEKDVVPKHANEHERDASDSTHQQQQQQNVQTEFFVQKMKNPSAMQRFQGLSVANNSLDVPTGHAYGLTV
ncbi:hypothetical protein LTR86_004424 [Recurvomyces mirabilis]|nr:hypothetical protein LTR86_004424 [Recurvomyces mirabilis]